MVKAARPTAVASSRTTLFGRRTRVIRYDARYADGRRRRRSSATAGKNSLGESVDLGRCRSTC